MFQAALPPLPATGLTGRDYSFDQQRLMMMGSQIEEGSSDDNDGVVNFMTNVNNVQQQQQLCSGFYLNNSLDRLSFADVMQFADLGPKLMLNQQGKSIPQEEEGAGGGAAGVDPAGYFLKFPVLNDKFDEDHLMGTGAINLENRKRDANEAEGGGGGGGGASENAAMPLRFLGENLEKSPTNTEAINNKSKRKRARSVKTSEEVESQRMTHIAVERNRRKQMNEHLRVLRSLMPGSYVQRVPFYILPLFPK